MQATNQSKQQSNFEREKLMAEWLTRMCGVQIQAHPNLIRCVWD